MLVISLEALCNTDGHMLSSDDWGKGEISGVHGDSWSHW